MRTEVVRGEWKQRIWGVDVVLEVKDSQRGMLRVVASKSTYF